MLFELYNLLHQSNGVSEEKTSLKLCKKKSMSNRSIVLVDELLKVFDKPSANKQNSSLTNRNEIDKNKTSQYLLMRILGNDLQGLHGDNQTVENLKFTLKYEADFKETDKIYVLNKIYDSKKKIEIIDILNQYGTKYIDIPFNFEEFKKLPKLQNVDIKQLKATELVYLLLKHNLYLVGINGCRNFCVRYGKKMGYKWTFVLDSNSFFVNS